MIKRHGSPSQILITHRANAKNAQDYSLANIGGSVQFFFLYFVSSSFLHRYSHTTHCHDPRRSLRRLSLFLSVPLPNPPLRIFSLGNCSRARVREREKPESLNKGSSSYCEGPVHDLTDQRRKVHCPLASTISLWHSAMLAGDLPTSSGRRSVSPSLFVPDAMERCIVDLSLGAYDCSLPYSLLAMQLYLCMYQSSTTALLPLSCSHLRVFLFRCEDTC